MKNLRDSLPALLILLGCRLVSAQPASPPQPDTVIRSSVREVVLDVTVRSKGEKLVRDLKPSEVDVYVDGVKQKVQSFRLVSGEEIRKMETAAANAREPGRAHKIDSLPAPNSPREINLVALVFRAGSTEERARARKAALTFFERELRPNTYIALLAVVGMRTRIIVPFTANRERLVTGVDRLFHTPTTPGNLSDLAALQLPSSSTSAPTAQNGPPAQAGAPPTPGQLDPTNPASSKLDAATSTGMGASTVKSLELEVAHIDMNTDALFEMDRLREVVNVIAGLPGRKTVVAFLNNVLSPPEQPEIFEKFIADARRRQITFYGVNLKGLGMDGSSLAVATAGTSNAASISPSQGKTAGGGVTFQTQTRAQIHQEDLVLASVRSMDSKNALRVLAESTGGFLIADTNDVAFQMPRIMDEVNTHYELAWAPSGSSSDGRFHRVEVRVKRPGYVALHRDGYFALPDLGGHKFEGFEVASLRSLAARPLPSDFDFRVRALRFKPDATTQKWDGVIAFEAPISSFSVMDPQAITGGSGGKMQVRAQAVALIKDSKGDIVDMVSNSLGYDVPAGRSNDFLAGNLSMALPVKLPPGRWVIEGLMRTQGGEAASARRIAVNIPDPGVPAVSSISLIRRIDGRSAAEESAPSPFDIGTSRVRPTLTGIVPNGAEARLYFVVYPAGGVSSGDLKINVQYWRDGKPVAGDIVDGKPDATGAVPIVASSRLDPGDYEVHVIAKQNGKATEEVGFIRVDP